MRWAPRSPAVQPPLAAIQPPANVRGWGNCHKPTQSRISQRDGQSPLDGADPDSAGLTTAGRPAGTLCRTPRKPAEHECFRAFRHVDACSAPIASHHMPGVRDVDSRAIRFQPLQTRAPDAHHSPDSGERSCHQLPLVLRCSRVPLPPSRNWLALPWLAHRDWWGAVSQCTQCTLCCGQHPRSQHSTRPRYMQERDRQMWWSRRVWVWPSKPCVSACCMGSTRG